MSLKNINDHFEKGSKIRNTLQEVTAPKELVWNVMFEDWNQGIGYINVFNCNWPFKESVYKAYKKYKNDFDKFSKAVHSSLMCEYWARSQYEIIVAPWPCRLSEEEVERLSQDIEKQKKTYPDAVYHSAYPRIERAIKVDIYSQIMMNWEVFINYLWENKKLINKFKKDLK